MNETQSKSCSSKIIVEMILYLLFVGLLGALHAQPANEEECVQLWLRQKPELRNRFTMEQIKWLCQRTSEWLTKALNPMSSAPTDDIITPNQRNYLNLLRNCTGAQCLQSLPGGSMEPRPTSITLKLREGRDIEDLSHSVKSRQTDRRAYRKEIRAMTDDERRRYQNAVIRLKTDKIDGLSKYDLFVIYHTPEEAPGAHWGPAFLPYHRELLKQYELALRQVDPSVSLPYWDSTLDEGLPTPKDSILWTEEFFGNGDNFVRIGSYANWNTTHELTSMPGMKRLYRDVGNSEFGGLYKSDDVNFILNRQNYEDLTSCVDPTFELVHGIVHMFVGGYMADIGISPNDPSFYNHHTFLDALWEEFRLNRQNPSQRENSYPSNDRSCNNFHYGDATMRPFTIRNKDGLSNTYTRELFQYQPRPSCAAGTCTSAYLFCDTRSNRCLSKIKSGGACTGFEGTSICFNGQCRNGQCYMGGVPETPGPVQTTTVRTTTTTRRPPPVTTTRRTRPPPTQTFRPIEPETTYDPPPPPPPPYTDTPNVNPSYPIVWFTCTVQRGTGAIGSPATGVSLRTIGQNVPMGYTDVLPGRLMNDVNYPSYNGAAVLQIRDPVSTGYMSMVEFRIDATDSSGRRCRLQCYSNTQRRYVNCNSDKFRVSTNSYYSDAIKTEQSQLTALESLWTPQLTRQPDYCLIQCP